MYDKSLIDEITKRADIVTVVGSYLNLIKKGKIYVAICPFHDDSNPSLQVNPERNTFHCWVDGHAGNAISFVMQYEHLSFPEAVKKVAEIIGFDDPRLYQHEYKKKIADNLMPLYTCINDLNAYYEYALITDEGEAALNYLNKRHIDEAMIKKFHIGYALMDGDKTVKFLQSKGHSLKTIEDIGVAPNRGDSTHDNNQGRLVFAITDQSGQVVGFSARKFKEEDGPKYVNTPETPIFTKGNILYNFANAKESARVSQYIYVLEGFMDVIALDKIGITSAVALMGTALSKTHIAMLKKLNVEVRLCLDGDLPGQEAMMRIVPVLLANGLNVRIVNNLNSPKDPDEILQTSGEEALKKYLNNLLSPFDFTIGFYKNTKALEATNDKKKLIVRFMPLLLATKSQLEFDDYVYKLSDVTGFSAGAIKQAVVSARRKKLNEEENYTDDAVDPSSIISTFHPERKELRRLEKAEREILYHMLSHDDALKFYETTVEVFYTNLYREIANYLLDYHAQHQAIDVNGVISAIEMSEAVNKERLRKELDLLASEKTHLKYSEKLLNDCKSIIDQERKIIDRKQRIRNATIGKTEEEKARVIADTLKVDN
ncbi:MAG: DNA primase [Bacilli bacterium]|nr:DNA primase [Bacilli bacterium]